MLPSVLEHLENSNKQYPDKVAIQDGSVFFTYAQLMKQAKQVGRLLANHTQPKQPVMILVNRSAHVPIACLATLYAGCFYVPVDMFMPAQRIQNIVDLVSPSVILIVEDQKNVLDKIQYHGAVLALEDCISENSPSKNALSERVTSENALSENVSLENFTSKDSTSESTKDLALSTRADQILDLDPLCILFTSGSTGKPKGVVISHRALNSRATLGIQLMGINADSIYGSLYPLYNSAALWELFAVLFSSATLVIIPQNMALSPAKMFDYINQHHISTLNLPATSISHCAKSGVFKHTSLPTVNTVGFGGASFSCEDLNIWLSHLPKTSFVNRFGSTEMNVLSAFQTQGGTNIDVLPLGKPSKNAHVFLLDEDNHLMKTGQMGELCARSLSMATGYYNAPELTAESFVQNPLNPHYPETIFRTGDLAVFDENGILFFRGRKDRQVKCMGHRVELDEIESAARTMPQIADCRSLYHKEEDRLYLFYVVHQTAEKQSTDSRSVATPKVSNIDAVKIRLYLRQKLPTYMIPHKFVRLENIPLNDSKKADYERLKQIMYEGDL